MSKLFISECVKPDFSSDRKREPEFAVGGSRSRKYAECSDFTLLFCRERLRNIQTLIMHVESHCSAN